MTRCVAHTNISTPAARARLRPREKPYWQAIDPGLHLGYRRGAVGGKWAVRIYLGAQKYQLTSFAIADDNVAADGKRVLSYIQAKRHALELAAAKPVGPLTVAEAMAEKGARPGLTSGAAPSTIVDKIGAERVDSLTTPMLDDWLASMVRGESPERIRASRASANRTMVILKAALNHAFKNDLCASAKAWAACEPFADVNKPRLRFFDRAEITRLMNATGQSDFGNLCRAALHSGARYGDLCKFVVGDFDAGSGTVWLVQGKTAAPRRIVLTAEGAGFFTSLTAGRASGDGSRSFSARTRSKARGLCWICNNSKRARPRSTPPMSRDASLR